MTGYPAARYSDPSRVREHVPDHQLLRQNMGYTGLITTDWLPSGAW